jgi:hypothetical protein
MASGFGAGLMGLVGGLAALGIGKAVGAVVEKVGAAEREAIGYDTLKRQIGDVNVSFDMLRRSVRASADVLNTNYDEAQRLASQFVRTANVGAGGAAGIGGELAVGGGLARALGLDLGAGVGFSAGMRQFGATEDETGSRRMALLVGETIARASGFAKAGEILQVISSFTEQQTRMGLNSANVPGYSGYLAAAMGSGIPGLDPTGAAGMLSRINSSVVSGGSEAGQNFYGFLGNSMGLDPLQMAVLREQGAFGTGRKAFGEGSVYGRFAAANGLSTPSMANSDQMTITSVMGQLRQQYGSNPMMMANAMQNLLGISLTQSMAFSSFSPTQLGGMENRLGRLGVNLGSIDADSVGMLGQIESGNRPALAQVARDLAGRTGKRALSAGEQGALQAAWDGGDDEKLRDTLAQLAAKYGQAETEGEKTRNSIEGVERVLQDFAGKLVPLAADMRSGILFMAGKGGEMSPDAIREAVLRSEGSQRLSDIAANSDAAIAAKQGTIEPLMQLKNAHWSETRDMIMSGKITPDGPEAAARFEHQRKLEADITAATAEIRALMEAKQRAIAEENRLIDQRVKDMQDAERKSRAAQDSLMLAGGTAVIPGDPSTRFPVTGTPAFNNGGAASGPAVSVSPQAGNVINPALAMTRGFRNNNPGNIEASAQFEGYVGSDGRFGKYATPELGYRALSKQLMRYQSHYGRNTVREIINRWAPPSENNTGAYVNQVAAQLGVSPDAPLDLKQQETLFGLVRAITGHENGGQLHSAETINAGVSMALGGGALPAAGPGASSGALGSGLFNPQMMGGGGGTFKLELSDEASRWFNPAAPVKQTFGPSIAGPGGAR